jgi:DNA-binding GntR family transcriptional regulator
VSELTKAEWTRMRLRKDILEGRYAPGDPISERLVAQQLEVSRIPVREALIQLQRDGLVAMTPGRGAYVRQMSSDNMQSLYEAREALEGQASRLAATRLEPGALARFTETYDRYLHDASSMDDAAAAVLGNEFHQVIIEGSRNTVIIELCRQISDRVELCRRLSYVRATREMGVRAAHEHVGIAEAIHQADPELAERRMREHIATWARFLKSHMTGDGPRPSR